MEVPFFIIKFDRFYADMVLQLAKNCQICYNNMPRKEKNFGINTYKFKVRAGLRRHLWIAREKSLP